VLGWGSPVPRPRFLQRKGSLQSLVKLASYLAVLLIYSQVIGEILRPLVR
jgi:hypothetical protein